MMSPTHVAAGSLLALPLLRVAPEFVVVGALAAMAGSVFPDLDLFVGRHRKTLHFPVLYWVPALVAIALAAVAPGTVTVAIALFFLACAVHSGTDWFGAGDELRPWEATSREAVYLHVRERWLPPKRLVRYDGAPEDVGLTLVLALPGLVVYEHPVRTLLLAAVGVGVVYGLVRKRSVGFFARFVE